MRSILIITNTILCYIDIYIDIKHSYRVVHFIGDQNIYIIYLCLHYIYNLNNLCLED